MCYSGDDTNFCPGSLSIATCLEFHVSYVCRLMDDNELKKEAVHRSPGIYFKTEENPGKPQLGDHLSRLITAVWSSITLT